MVLQTLRPAATAMQKERMSRFMTVRHTQPSTSNILALNCQRRFYTNYFFSPSTHASEGPGIKAMEHWGADAAVLKYSRPDNKDLFRGDQSSLPELHFLNLHAKLEMIDVREDVASVSCTIEVISKSGADPFGARFIFPDAIAVANGCARDRLLKTLSEERCRICVFRAEKSRTANECNDTTASMYFLIRGTVLKDLLKQLAKVNGFGEVRCLAMIEPQGGILWIDQSPPRKSE